VKELSEIWGQNPVGHGGLLKKCRDALGIVLPLQDHEREFLDRLIDHGQIEPSILTKDAELINGFDGILP